jgi:prephenate dehydrogenase
MKDLQQVSVLGLGLLGGSVTLAVSGALPAVRTVGYTHRPSTRTKARRLNVASLITGSLAAAVADADLVILATPISIFENTMQRIAESLKPGCIVTDVGSTKLMPHRWAKRCLPRTVHYIGSHPIAGSEKRGIEYARDDLFYNAPCIITPTAGSDASAVETLQAFWSALGAHISLVTPARHDKVFADVSHLPHILAAALINASDSEELKFAGKGFIDTSRIASGPANIWTDVLNTNPVNCIRGIDRVIRELNKIRTAISSAETAKITRLLEQARAKRSRLIHYKLKKKELL